MITFVTIDSLTRTISGIQQTPAVSLPKSNASRIFIQVPNKLFGILFRTNYGRVIYRHTTTRRSGRKFSAIFDRYNIEVMQDFTIRELT